MNITLKQVRAFSLIANTGSFADASEQLHLTQPALSVAIGKLEAELGGKLFARTTRRLSLTPEGRAFLPVSRRLLRDWGEAFDDLHRLFSLQQGKLTVAAMPSFASTRLPQLLADYQRCFPNINITVQDVVMEEVLDAVASGRSDLGITFESGFPGLRFDALYPDRFIAVLPPGHTLLDNGRLTFRQLARHPFLALNKGSSTRSWLEQLFVDTGVNPPQIFDAFQLTTIGAMVAAGLGVSLVPALCRQQMENLGAVCRDISGVSLEKMVGVYTPRRLPLSQPAEQMLALLRQGSG